MGAGRGKTMAETGGPKGQLSMVEWMFRHSQELMVTVSPEGRFILLNPAWEAATGWSVDQLLGRPVAELIHPDDQAAFRAHGRRLRKDRLSENLCRVRMKDGSWRWFSGRAQLTDNGLMIGVLRDATEDQARQAELQEARRTRLLLSEAAGVGAWSYEPHDNAVTWSEEILAVTGFDPAKIRTPEEFFAVLHPDERARVEAAFAEGVERGVARSLDHRMRTPDGRWTTWRATFRCEARADGLHALKGISQNITELVAARDLARASERQMALLVENAPFAVAMFDREMRYLVASPRWNEIFRLEGRAHIGRPLRQVSHGMPRRFLEAERRVLEGEVVSRAEDRFADGQGQSHWVRWEARPWRDAEGRVAGMVAYVDDISSLTQAREAARSNARRLKVALAAADAGVYEIDHMARTFWASPEFKKLFGTNRATYEDALHLRFPTFHPDDLESVRQAFRDIQSGARKAGEAFEARILKPDGEARWVRVFHHLQKDARGRWLKGVGLVHDFDERKRQELALIAAERAAQGAAEAKAQFLANMSHEIRTPMNGVLGVLHLLKSETLSEEGRRLLDEALSCGHMLAELLNDVIDFSKIEAGRLELAYEPLDPRALIEGVVRLLAPQATERGLQLRADLPADLGWVRGEPTRLRQALFNLVGNAVKFTLDGHVLVRARQVDGAGGPRLRFEVEDTGVGIPAEVQPRIFQRFDQGDASTTRRFGGSGLGLAITQRLAQMMGGEVGFTSVQGRGSTFWLEVAAEPVQAPERPADALPDFLSGVRVLVVEDNPTNRLIATKLLEKLGASVETASDGYLGVEAAERQAFDLILMDVQMPGIDGLEAARRIRALPTPAAATPIVALTANVMAHQRQAYLEAGMDGVVGKPISPAALLTEIARLGDPGAQGSDDMAVA